MNKYFRTIGSMAFAVLSICVISCKKDMSRFPSPSTLDVTNITKTSATLGGEITFIGDPEYTERGICYSTSENPTINSNRIVDSGSGTKPYTTEVTGLNEGTTYYVRAYAISKKGTAYGNQVAFTTLATPALVRFKKEFFYSDTYAGRYTRLRVGESDGVHTVEHFFGTSNGVSNYYELFPGSYYRYFYNSYEAYWSIGFSTTDNNAYNFQSGHKYSVVLSENEYYMLWYVTDEGTY